MAKTTKALRLVAPGELEIATRPLPDLGRQQLMVQVDEVGLCSGEVAKWLGDSPLPGGGWIGHEMTGHIVSVGADARDRFAVGERVIGWTPRGDAMAELIIMEARHAVIVPEEAAGAVHAEPLMCCVATVEKVARMAPIDGAHIAFIGPGYMGAMTLRLLRERHPASLVAVARSVPSLSRALSWGATDVVPTSGGDVRAAFEERTGQEHADIVIESTGTQAGMDAMWPLAGFGGLTVMQGFHESDGGDRAMPMVEHNWKGLTTTSAHFRDWEREIGPAFRTAAELITAGAMPLDSLVTHRVRLREARDLFAAAVDRRTGYVKGVIDFGSGR